MKISKADIDAVSLQSDKVLNSIKIKTKQAFPQSEKFKNIHKLNKKQSLIAAEVMGQYIDLDFLVMYFNEGKFDENPFFKKYITMKINKIQSVNRKNRPKH
jgi:hypothetical protein